jgi:hypothetical protein
MPVQLGNILNEMRVLRLIVSLWLLLFSVLAHGGDGVSAGFLYDRFPLTLHPGDRTEAIGPLFYSEQQEFTRTWAISPLLSHHTDPGTDSEEWDFLYPVASLDRFGTEYRWHLFQLFSFAGGEDQEQQKAKRFTLFPIYFQQRSDDPELNYTAVVPFYGHLKKRLLRDEIFFAAFPIYSKTRKKDVVTENFVYPLVHLRTGDGLRGWQIWPLYGQEHKEVTYRTNGFGDVTLVGGKDSRFVLWPIYLEQTSEIGTTNQLWQQAVLPLYSLVRSPARDSTTVVWPFFTHITDREKKYTEWQTPWPLIVFARGEGKRTSRVWPFFSQAESTNLQSAFYMWPIYKYNRVHGESVDRDRTRILLFLYSDIVQRNLDTGKAQRRMDVWPLFTRREDYNGSSRLQVLSLLEPLVPNSKSIERNYSQLWALWRSERNMETQATSQSLLWNLYRRDTLGDARKCSLLFGLFQYQSGSDGRHWRLFHVPMGRQHKAPDAGR